MHKRHRPRLKLNLSDARYRTDPWQAYRQLRELGPVLPTKMPLIGKCWSATTYDAVSDVLKQSECFVRDPRNAGRKTFMRMQWMFPRTLLSLAENMLAADEDRHRRLRSLVEQAFTRRNIEGMSERLETLAEEQLDVVAEVGRQQGVVDLVDQYARPFPLTVICELLGLTAADRPKFKRWFAPLSKVSGFMGLLSLAGGARQVMKYLRGQFEEVRQRPRPGLMSELVQAEYEGQRLNEDELLSMVFLLLVAGHETTVHLISNAILTLFQFPHCRGELLSEPSLYDPAIEEVLRYSSPLQMGKPRYVARNREFYGQSLQRGELIMPLIASANYDPDRFEDPELFNIHRPANYHLSFGSGPHTCLGIKLARLEARFALEGLFQRWPDVQPAFDVAHPDWTRRLGTRGMRSLPVELA